MSTDTQRHRTLTEVRGLTLDGRPARIIGAQCPYALVAQFDRPYTSHEYAWPTIERIVALGGAFRS